jgi:hypothetical protein
LTNTIIGNSISYAGVVGGGNDFPTIYQGSSGGGGAGANGSGTIVVPVQGTDGLGGGGGGGRGGGTASGAKGGSGIEIIRYITPTTSLVIELIKGTTTDSKTDYRIGNYDGTFKVKLAVNNYEVDVLSVGETSGIITAPFGITTPLNVAVSTLNNINPSDWLRKSECVLYLEAVSRTQAGSWTSVFHIDINLIRSYYDRPQLQWRLRFGFSTTDTLSTFVYGFFSVVYDQYANFFTYFIDIGSSGVYISQSWNGS